jgi:hypothetical protein
MTEALARWASWLNADIFIDLRQFKNEVHHPEAILRRAPKDRLMLNTT